MCCVPLAVNSRVERHAQSAAAGPSWGTAQAALPQLLETVCEQMKADIAVLLRVDAGGNVQYVADSYGFDHIARAGVRVPVGAGFAGTVAASGRPLVVQDITAGSAPYSDLLPALGVGIRSVLGVPVTSNEKTHSVLYVGTRVAGALSVRQAAELTGLAGRLHNVDVVRQGRENDLAARVLQHSLLPSTPPPVPGFDLAARYLPADGNLGGDWFDVFALPGGRVGFVMGDVAGHGLQPAIVMGRLRSALRAYALDHDDPAEVLSHLNRKITHFETGVFATVLFGVSRPPYDMVAFSSAGHLPPAIARPDAATTLIGVQPDPPLGVRYGAPRRTTTVHLAPGDSLCLYTDGLVERIRIGGQDQHLEGLTLLRRVFAAEPAELAATTVIDGLVRGDTDDDVALLIARRI